MKKNTIAMKVISILAAIALVITTCFIPETSWAGEEEGQVGQQVAETEEQSSESIDDNSEQEESVETQYITYTCGDLKYLNDDNYIIVHQHDTNYCYAEDGVTLICPFVGSNVVSELHTHGEECYTWISEEEYNSKVDSQGDGSTGDNSATIGDENSTGKEDSDEEETTTGEEDLEDGENSESETSTEDGNGENSTDNGESEEVETTTEEETTTTQEQEVAEPQNVEEPEGSTPEESQDSTQNGAEPEKTDSTPSGSEGSATTQGATESARLNIVIGGYLYGDVEGEPVAAEQDDTPSEEPAEVDTGGTTTETPASTGGDTSSQATEETVTKYYRDVKCGNLGVHEHDEKECYNDEGELICRIKSVEEIKHVITHVHDDSCALKAGVVPKISKEELALIIRGEISDLINSGTTEEVPFFEYYDYLKSTPTDEEELISKAEGYNVDKDILAEYMGELVAQIDSYDELIDNAINADERLKDIDTKSSKYRTIYDEVYSEYIEKMKTAVTDETALMEFAASIGLDENVDTLIFKFTLLYLIDKESMKAVGTVATYNSEEEPEYYVGVRDKDSLKLKNYSEWVNPYKEYVFQALYVIKASDYNIETSYRDVETRKSKSKVAYCFNKARQYIPSNDFWGTWNYSTNDLANARCLYSLVENASGDDFVYYASTYDETYGTTICNVRLRGEDLRKMIISVALNGYPTNYSGFYDSSTISNSQARLLTQFAIWYFTDSYDLDTTGLTSEEKDLYQKLISTELPDSVTSYAASSVNIFRYEGCEDGLLRQNLLTVETKEPETTPETPNDTLSLTLTKKAIGNIPSGSKFHFTLILKDKDGNLIQSTSNTLVKFNSKGEAEFDLGVNESLTIEGLPYGYSYSIKENNALNYDTVIKIGSGGIADIDNENKSISKPYVTSNEEIEYQNKILYSLVLSKEVNNDNDRNKEFEFIMELKDAEGKPYTSNLNYVSDGASGVITFDEKGKSNPFKIKGGSQIEISNQLPSGYNLTINENDDKYYTKITAYNSKNEIIQKLENTKSMSFSDLSDNLSIVYRNTPEEEKDNISISITKNVNSSNTADKTKQYKFRIKITKDGKPIDKERLYYYVGAGKSIQSIILENGEGIIDVSAGSNQYVTTVGGEFGIPSGCNIEIEEIEAEGFITNITVGDTEYTNTKTVILNNVTKDTDIVYTNNQQVVVPTGIRIDILPYLIIMLLAMGAVVGFVIRRRVVKGR